LQKTIPERICLIIPPSIFLLDERVFMSLGILKVAAVLERMGSSVEMLDLSGVANYLDVVRDHVKSSSTQIFGITATTPLMPAAAEIVAVIKGVRPNAKVILGGPHITLVQAAYKKEVKTGIIGRAVRAMRQAEEMFDVLVAGDGEEAIFFACDPNAPKLIDADDPASSLFLTNAKLTDLPFPARHLVDVSSYHYSIEGVPAISLIAQLGCPFACGFCGGRESPMLRKIRMRTSENIVAEMVHLYKTYGIKGFMMYDDELNVNPKMIELMNLIAKAQRDLGVEWRLRGFIKAQLFTDPQAKAMYEAGFRWILTGFESGSPRILKNINKQSTQEENTRCVEIAHRNGLKVKALMSIGHPGENRETIQDTLNWLLQVKPGDIDVTIITCYAGTPYYDQAVPHKTLPGVYTYTFQKTGDQLHQYEVDYTKVADYYKGDPNGGYKAYVFTDSLTSEDLVQERDRIEKEVRMALNIPFYHGSVAMRYEHSMGQMGGIPENILRVSK
jgi:anaerobic magnesium-protoporphyrin IX monomethyl ester cyclase